MHECMALFTWTRVLLSVLPLPCFIHVLLQALTVRSPLVSCV